MKSVTPVSSLSSAVNEILEDDMGNKRSIEGLEKDDLLAHIQQLFKKDVDRQGIQFSIEKPPPGLSICADREQNKIIITVTDNGMGIDAEIADQVFIPFFTTRKTGSGIGLSLSKQIMRLHKGNIKFRSSEKGTTFALEF